MATKKELELELEDANAVLDAITDVLDDEELGAAAKVKAVQEELEDEDA